MWKSVYIYESYRKINSGVPPFGPPGRFSTTHVCTLTGADFQFLFDGWQLAKAVDIDVVLLSWLTGYKFQFRYIDFVGDAQRNDFCPCASRCHTFQHSCFRLQRNGYKDQHCAKNDREEAQHIRPHVQNARRQADKTSSLWHNGREKQERKTQKEMGRRSGLVQRIFAPCMDWRRTGGGGDVS